MVDFRDLEGKANIKIDVALKLLNTIDCLNKAIPEADHNELRAITEGVEDIAFTLKKLYEEGEPK